MPEEGEGLVVVPLWTGPADCDDPVCLLDEVGDEPEPVGTLSTYSFGAEVGCGLEVAGAVEVGAGEVCVMVPVVWP